MSQNKISATLSPAALTAINSALATIRTNLPFLINLSDDERKNMPKAGDGSQSFIQQSLNFASQHPEALPSTFNTVEFTKDGALFSPLTGVHASLSQLQTDLDDTFRALNSDLFAESLDVYAYARANNRSGAFNTYVDSAKARFAQGPRKKKAVPTP
jgi:hypothetical protein